MLEPGDPSALCMYVCLRVHSYRLRLHAPMCCCYMWAPAYPLIASSDFTVHVMSSTPAMRICLGANPPRTDKSVTGYQGYPHGFVCPEPLHRFTVCTYGKAYSSAPTAASKSTFPCTFKFKHCLLSCPSRRSPGYWFLIAIYCLSDQ